MIEQRIEELLKLKFEEEGFQDLYLVELSLNQQKGKKLDVYIESDQALTIDICAKVSRYLRHHIEEENLLGEVYYMDVSSPGVGKPLKLKRQYTKNIGRVLEVSLKEVDKKIKGRLLRIEDEEIVLEQEVKEAKVKGKKAKKIKVETPIRFEDIERTIVKITF